MENDVLSLAIAPKDFYYINTSLLKDEISFLEQLSQMTPNDRRMHDYYKIKQVTPSIEGASDVTIVSGTFVLLERSIQTQELNFTNHLSS